MPQFHQAWAALQSKNTSEFNKSYGYVSPPSSRPTTPTRNLKKIPSQFNLAKLSLERSSPVPFNEAYGFSSRRKKSRKLRKSRRSTRKARR
jgi:hypothetical protein